LAGTGLLGQPHVRHAILGGGAEATDDEEEPRVYTSLTTAANTAMDRYMDQQLRGPRSHMNCFICNFQERSLPLFASHITRVMGCDVCL
jgi:hypothetical protein